MRSSGARSRSLELGTNRISSPSVPQCALQACSVAEHAAAIRPKRGVGRRAFRGERQAAASRLDALARSESHGSVLRERPADRPKARTFAAPQPISTDALPIASPSSSCSVMPCAAQYACFAERRSRSALDMPLHTAAASLPPASRASSLSMRRSIA